MRPRVRLAQLAARGDERAPKRHRTRRRFVASGREEDGPRLARREPQFIDGTVRRQPVRCRIEGQRGPAQLAVEAVIVQQHLIVAAELRRRGTAARAMGAAHLEQVGEVVGEQNRQTNIDRLVAVIAHAEALIGGIPPQENCAQNVHGIFFQHDTLIGHDVGIGQVDDQRRVVVAQIRAEQQRLRVVDPQFEPREKPRVAVEQPVGSLGCADIAMAVEHDEGVVMLERQSRPGRGRGGGNVEGSFRRCGD